MAGIDFMGGATKFFALITFMAGIVATSAVITNLTVGTAVVTNVGSNLVPLTNAKYDLGSTALNWNNMYVSGTANFATVSSTVGNFQSVTTSYLGVTQGVNTALIPDKANAYTIGSQSSGWGTIYTSGVAYSGGNINTTYNSITGASTTRAFGVGFNTNYDQAIFVSEYAFAFNNGGGSQTTPQVSLIESTSGTVKIWEPGTQLGNLLVGNVTSTFVYPAANATYDLGSYADSWRNVYVSSTEFNSGVSSTGGLYPTSNNAYNLGGMNLTWANVYASGTVSAAKVGANESSPTDALDVQGSASATTFLASNGSTVAAGLSFSEFTQDGLYEAAIVGGAGGGQLRLEQGGTDYLRFAGSVVSSTVNIQPTTNNTLSLGAFGNAWQNVYVSGTIPNVSSTEVTASNSGGTAVSSTGAVYMNGLGTSSAAASVLCAVTSTSGVQVMENVNASTCTVSSRRFKHDIADLSDKLAQVLALHPIQFENNGTNEKDIGFLAEEVKKVDPRLVFYEADGKTPRGVKYENMTALLAKGIQEQQGEIEQLGVNADKMQNEIDALKAGQVKTNHRINFLEHLIQWIEDMLHRMTRGKRYAKP